MRDPMTIAVIRGAYTAIGAGALAFLTSLSVGTDARGALIVGGISALGALGFRGGVEGFVDQKRSNSNGE